MTMLDYFRVLQRGWLLIVALTVAGLALAFLGTRTQTPVFVSSGSVLMAATGQPGGEAFSQGTSLALQRGSTYAALAGSDVVLGPAAQQLGEPISALRGSVSTSARDGVAVIDVTAQASTADEAARRAAAVAQQLSVLATQVDTSAAGLLTLQVITQPQPPGAAISPRPLNNLVIGGVVGLTLGVALVVAANAVATRVRTTADLPSDPRIVTVTSLPVRRGRSLLTAQRGDMRLEAFRHLRTNLQFSSSTGKQIAVAGTTSNCDAGAVAQQLASAMGEIGMRVVLLDASLRPKQESRRQSPAPPATPGLADVLAGSVTLDSVVQHSPDEGVDVIRSGRVEEWSAHLISTSTMADLLGELAERYDFVIVSAPPVLEQAESVVAAALCGSSLLVIESGDTRRTQVVNALDLLEGAGVVSVSVAVDHVSLRGDTGVRRELAQADVSRP